MKTLAKRSKILVIYFGDSLFVTSKSHFQYLFFRTLLFSLYEIAAFSVITVWILLSGWVEPDITLQGRSKGSAADRFTPTDISAMHNHRVLRICDFLFDFLLIFYPRPVTPKRNQSICKNHKYFGEKCLIFCQRIKQEIGLIWQIIF